MTSMRHRAIIAVTSIVLVSGCQDAHPNKTQKASGTETSTLEERVFELSSEELTILCPSMKTQTKFLEQANVVASQRNVTREAVVSAAENQCPE